MSAMFLSLYSFILFRYRKKVKTIHRVIPGMDMKLNMVN